MSTITGKPSRVGDGVPKVRDTKTISPDEQTEKFAKLDEYYNELVQRSRTYTVARDFPENAQHLEGRIEELNTIIEELGELL